MKEDLALLDVGFEDLIDVLEDFTSKHDLVFDYDGNMIVFPELKAQIRYVLLDGTDYTRTHLLKQSQSLDDANIRSIQLFESEWRNPVKHRVVIRKLKSLIGITQTIGARVCQVDTQVPTSEVRSFLENYHIQGFFPAKVSVGLRYEGTLVSLMTFGHPRFNRQYDWEIIRMCSRCNVSGGASRMFSAFRKEHTGSVITYCDRRWGEGGVYKHLGMQELTPSAPGYWYYKVGDLKLFHRVFAQKHKLRNLLSDFDPSKTEVENMRSHGWSRIWDCGNKVFYVE